MVKTKFDKIDVGIPDVAAFRIEGKLGFHENAKIQRLVGECVKREYRAVIIDFSELASLGGGVAKILRDFDAAIGERGGRVNFVVTKEIVAQFLQDGAKPVLIYRSFAEALAAAKQEAPRGAAPEAAEAPAAEVPQTSRGKKAGARAEADVICMPYEGPETGPAGREQEAASPDAADEGVSGEDPAVAESAGEPMASPESLEEPAAGGESAARNGENGSEAEGIIGEIFGSAAETVEVEPPKRAAKEEPAPPTRASVNVAVDDLNRQLKRRILELRTLFSISSDFNAIRDRKKLIDIFLLTSIAEGGVESAAFLEHQGTCFKPVMSKGIDAETMARLEVPVGACSAGAGDNDIFPLESFPLEPSWKKAIGAEGIEYACPFRTKDGLSGIVLLGKRIMGRGMKQEDFEFLRILLNIAQGAYDNALMFEREHERTLGIVKTLMSIIEDNTLLKGTSEFVSRYVGMTAKGMDYPEEHFKDLIYGTVLRDMGMVKVSDLILRSPRDLSKEEWEIIKRHPEDGGEMLDRMKFADHVVNIVRTHHERFNGEGYPYGLRGKEIPLGSRIISVVESYAAMIHERPTRPALSQREALDTLKENYGLRYDREVVVKFSSIMEKEIARSVQTGTAVLQGR